jgi:hypothetical protein
LILELSVAGYCLPKGWIDSENRAIPTAKIRDVFRRKQSSWYAANYQSAPHQSLRVEGGIYRYSLVDGELGVLSTRTQNELPIHTLLLYHVSDLDPYLKSSNSSLKPWFKHDYFNTRIPEYVWDMDQNLFIVAESNM